METLNFIQQNGSSTHVVPASDSEDSLYTIESYAQPQGLHTATFVRNSYNNEKSGIELASVSYVDFSETWVKFGAQTFDLNAFLRRRNQFSNSRIFVAPDGQTYKWSIHGKKLELHHADSHTLIARSHPKQGPTLFRSKARPASLEVVRDIVTAVNPKMLDAILITYSIMQYKLDERLEYRWPYAS